jgi:hypothetical protein
VLLVLRAVCLAMTLVVLSMQSASADTGSEPGANAALQYWQAFATLPEFTVGEHKMLEKSLTMPLDEHARQMVTKAEYAVRMMHRGAARRHCDWGLGYEEGMEHRFPHAEAARVLRGLVCMRARLLFLDGKRAEAIDDIVAIQTMGRHLSQDGSLISILVCYSIERLMGETIALHLPQLDAKQINELKKRLDALPPCASPATSVERFEVKGLDWFVGRVKEAKNKDRLLALVKVDLDMSPEEALALYETCGGTVDGVLKCADEIRPCFALLAKELQLPLDKFEEEWKREEKKRAGNPLFKRFMPALAQMAWRQAQAEVRRSLLRAAFALQLNESDALLKHLDPVVGGPFQYMALAGGFELRSTVKGRPNPDAEDDQPVTLVVGRRGK